MILCNAVSAEGYDPEADEGGDDPRVSVVTNNGNLLIDWINVASNIPVSKLVACMQTVVPKSDEQRKRLTEAIKHIFLFRALDAVCTLFGVYVNALRSVVVVLLLVSAMCVWL
jgi:hypothetical protein